MANEPQLLLAMISAGCLIATLLAACLTDIAAHRIPNALLLPALLVAVGVATATSGTHGLLLSLAGVGIGLAMLMPLYALGAMGAGDVKLLGVAGAFVGPFGILISGLATFIAGGILGVLYMGWHALRQAPEQRTLADNSRGTAVATGPAFNALAAQFPGLAAKLATVLPAPGSAGAVATRESARKNSTFAYAPAIAIGVAFAIWQQGWPILISWR